MTLQRYAQIVSLLGSADDVASLDHTLRQIATVVEQVHGGDPLWGDSAIQIADELRDTAGKLPRV